MTDSKRSLSLRLSLASVALAASTLAAASATGCSSSASSTPDGGTGTGTGTGTGPTTDGGTGTTTVGSTDAGDVTTPDGSTTTPVGDASTGGTNTSAAFRVVTLPDPASPDSPERVTGIYCTATNKCVVSTDPFGDVGHTYSSDGKTITGALVSGTSDYVTAKFHQDYDIEFDGTSIRPTRRPRSRRRSSVIAQPIRPFAIPIRASASPRTSLKRITSRPISRS